MTQWILIGSLLVSLAAAVGCSDSKEPEADETSGGEKLDEAGDTVEEAAEDTADAVDEAAEDATN